MNYSIRVLLCPTFRLYRPVLVFYCDRETTPAAGRAAVSFFFVFLHHVLFQSFFLSATDDLIASDRRMWSNKSTEMGSSWWRDLEWAILIPLPLNWKKSKREQKGMIRNPLKVCVCVCVCVCVLSLVAFHSYSVSPSPSVPSFPNDFTGFLPVFFYRVSLFVFLCLEGLTDFDEVLIGFIEFYRFLPY